MWRVDDCVLLMVIYFIVGCVTLMCQSFLSGCVVFGFFSTIVFGLVVVMDF